MNDYKYNGCTNRQAIGFYEELKSTLGQYTSGCQITRDNEVYVSYTLLTESGRHTDEWLIEYDDFFAVLDFNTHQVEIAVSGKEIDKWYLYDNKATLQDIRDILESADCKYGERMSLYKCQEMEIAEYVAQRKRQEKST